MKSSTSTPDGVVSRLLDDAASCHVYSLLRLADAHQEEAQDEDDFDKARGYRWLAENGRWPQMKPHYVGEKYRQSFTWFVRFEEPSSGVFEWEKYECDDLPCGVIVYHHGEQGRTTHNWTPRMEFDECLEAGALAVGRWLRQTEGEKNA